MPKENLVRFTATVAADTKQQLQYYASKKGISINEALREAVDMYIAHQNKDYDLPALEIQRLNQLVDRIEVLASSQKSLESVVTSGFDSLMKLARGDSYLLDEPDRKPGE